MIADHNGKPADGEIGLGPGYIFSPYIPREREPAPIDPNDFSLRKGIRTRLGQSVLFPPEPSAVDRLAALSDPDGEAGKLVQAWEEAEEKRRERRGKWKVYKDPLIAYHDRGGPLVRPEFFGKCTIKNL